MQTGDLVKSRRPTRTRDADYALGLVIDIMTCSERLAVRILLNDGKAIWVGSEMLEVINETR